MPSSQSGLFFIAYCCCWLCCCLNVSTAAIIHLRFEDILDGAHKIGSLRERLASEAVGRFPEWQFGRGVVCQLDSDLKGARIFVDSFGNILATNGIDRELTCPSTSTVIDCRSIASSSDVCIVRGRMRVQDTTQPNNYLDVQLEVSVRDKDTKPTRFQSSFELFKINENAPLEYRFPLPLASDPDDSGRATCRLKYSLTNCSGSALTDTGPFQLEVVDVPEPFMKLVGRLDAEQMYAYRYCLTATDPFGGGHFTASLTISIIVRDVNDNAPVWSPDQLFSVSVPERNPPEVLLRLSATDADRDFGLITYRLVRQHSLFIVNAHGELRLRTQNSLDYEEPRGRQHRLVAAAIDNGLDGDVKSVTATLTVNVLDSNDNPPMFNVLRQAVKLTENAPIPDLVQRFFVSDPDSGPNAVVTCSLMRPSGMFELAQVSNTSDAEFALHLVRALDRESAEQHRVDIRCVDAGEPQLSSEASILVTVLDRNDNAPRFDSQPLSFTVNEATPVGTVVFQVYF